jgi:uncharacterized protein (DUF2141 family)
MLKKTDLNYNSAIINVLFIFAVSLLLLKCAIQGFPPGGPEDKTPPQIVQIFPASDSTGVGIYLKEIKIIFSERMNEGSIPQNLFISPILKYDIKWRRSKELTITIDDTLKKEQTYIITIGSEAQDEHSNKLVQSFQSAFSTGSQIDHGSISGRVYELKPKETVNLFAYMIQDSSKSGFDKRKPDYVIQSGDGGQYKFDYLKAGYYRLFAAQDQNGNLLIDPLFERYGIPYRDVLIDSSRMFFDNLGFRLSKSDTTRPKLLSAKSLNFHTIRLRLSKPVKTPSSGAVTIIDTLTGKAVSILGITQSREEDFFLEIFTDSLPKDHFYKAAVSELSDSLGNISRRKHFTRSFPGSAKADTAALRLTRFTPKDSSADIYPDKKIYIEFSRAMNWNTLYKSFELRQNNGSRIKGHWRHKSLYSAEFIPNTKLSADTSYLAQLRLGAVRDLYGSALEDTVIEHRFTVISLNKLGEISGTVTIEQPPAPIILNFKALKGKKRNYQLTLDAPGKFYKPYLPAGNYQISAFLDIDNNGRYSYGKLEPFSFSEPFTFLRDTINVRSRWETSDVTIHIPFGQKR